MRRIIKKEILFTFLRVAISFGLLAYLILYVDIRTIYDKLITSNIKVILLVILLSFLNLFLQYEKWRLVCSNQLGINDRRRILYSLFYGISAGIFTPMKFGEYVARAIPFESKSVLDVTVATLVDKIIPMIIVLMIGLISMFYYAVDMNFLLLDQVFYLCGVVILLATLFVYFFINNKQSFKNVIMRLKNTKLLKKFLERLEVIKLLRGKLLAKLLIISLVYHLTFTSQLALLIYAFSHEFNYLLYLYIANLVIFVQVIIPPVALGELGVREGAAVYFAQNLGLDPSIGFNAAFFLFLINFILPSLYGLFLLTKKIK